MNFIAINQHNKGLSILLIKKKEDKLEWLKEFAKEQRQFDKQVIKRLDIVESKVDSVSLDLKETKLRNNLR